MTCPVCDRPEAHDRCDCGYDFTTRDPSRAIERFSTEARRGNNVWRRGLVALIVLPVTFSLGSLAMGMMLGMIQLGLATLWIVQGLVRADVANKRLAAAKQLIALPTARLLR
jgi:hypothetical protein